MEPILWILLGVFATIGLWWLVSWKLTGLGAGRAFGNRVADSLGWEKNFFHAVLDAGTDDKSLMLLLQMKHAGVSPRDASVMLAPPLAQGLERIELRFGGQTQIARAKPIIERLLQDHQRLVESQ